MSKINVTHKEGTEVVPVEILAQAIVDISKGMYKLNQSRLTTNAIVTLISRSSGIGRADIELVMKHLNELENRWLKPLKKK